MTTYVKKHSAPVRICLPGQDPIDGVLSLAPHSPTHDGPETLLDLLNSRVRVIPFLQPETSSVLMVTRLNIDWVVAGLGVEERLIDALAYHVTREETVQVTFNDGRAIDGVVQIELQSGSHRVSDFMNGPQDFFPLRTRIGAVIVNKARIRDTRLVSVPS